MTPISQTNPIILFNFLPVISGFSRCCFLFSILLRSNLATAALIWHCDPHFSFSDASFSISISYLLPQYHHVCYQLSFASSVLPISMPLLSMVFFSRWYPRAHLGTKSKPTSADDIDCNWLQLQPTAIQTCQQARSGVFRVGMLDQFLFRLFLPSWCGFQTAKHDPIHYNSTVPYSDIQHHLVDKWSCSSNYLSILW